MFAVARMSDINRSPSKDRSPSRSPAKLTKKLTTKPKEPSIP